MISQDDKIQADYFLYLLDKPYFITTPGDQNEVDLATGQAIKMTYGLKLARAINSTSFTYAFSQLRNSLQNFALVDPSVLTEKLSSDLGKDLSINGEAFELELTTSKDPSEPDILQFKRDLIKSVEKMKNLGAKYIKTASTDMGRNGGRKGPKGSFPVVPVLLGMGVISIMAYFYFREMKNASA